MGVYNRTSTPELREESSFLQYKAKKRPARLVCTGTVNLPAITNNRITGNFNAEHFRLTRLSPLWNASILHGLFVLDVYLKLHGLVIFVQSKLHCGYLRIYTLIFFFDELQIIVYVLVFRCGLL